MRREMGITSPTSTMTTDAAPISASTSPGWSYSVLPTAHCGGRPTRPSVPNYVLGEMTENPGFPDNLYADVYLDFDAHDPAVEHFDPLTTDAPLDIQSSPGLL